jgi:hypothetical protein
MLKTMFKQMSEGSSGSGSDMCLVALGSNFGWNIDYHDRKFSKFSSGSSDKRRDCAFNIPQYSLLNISSSSDRTFADPERQIK